MSTRNVVADRTEIVARLDALAEELAARGWASSVQAPNGRLPRLHARNPVPGAGALSEDIFAQPRADGTWVYWWPWAQPIAEAADRTAEVIVRVLRPADEP